MKAEVAHINAMTFIARMGKHEVTFDTKAPAGKDQGASPKEMLLSSILACSGMDVASLLRKYKMTPEKFSMRAEATPRDEHPRIFPRIDIAFAIDGEGLDLEKIKEAVHLSMSKYCGVSAMINATSPIHYVIELNGKVVFADQAGF